MLIIVQILQGAGAIWQDQTGHDNQTYHKALLDELDLITP